MYETLMYGKNTSGTQEGHIPLSFFSKVKFA